MEAIRLGYTNSFSALASPVLVYGKEISIWDVPLKEPNPNAIVIGWIYGALQQRKIYVIQMETVHFYRLIHLIQFYYTFLLGPPLV